MPVSPFNPAGERIRRPREPIDPNHPTPEVLLWAYAQGLFPMADPHTGELDWYSPDPRALLPLDDRFHTPKSLARIVRRNPFEIRSDTAFEDVMRNCAQPRAADDLTWISEELIHTYTELHELGHAHSIEAWLNGTLVGGLYGVHIGAAFFGESMFSRPDLGGSNASKCCLIHLVKHLREQEFLLLDTQFTNHHLKQFGIIEISRADYLDQLHNALGQVGVW